MKSQKYVEIKIKYPKELQFALRKNGKDIVNQFKLAAAIELFRENILSLGKAAKLSGMNQYEFIRELGARKVSIFKIDEKELKEDISNA